MLLLLAAGCGAAFLVYVPLRPPAGEVFIYFPAGTTSADMAGKLQAAGVVRSRYGFLLLRLWKGGNLKAGEYRFSGAASAMNV